MPSALKQFLPFIEQKFPRLARQYRDWYARSGYAPEAYRREIAERVRALRAKYGFTARPYDADRLAWHSPQLALALEVPAEPAPDQANPPRGVRLPPLVSSLSTTPARGLCALHPTERGGAGAP